MTVQVEVVLKSSGVHENSENRRGALPPKGLAAAIVDNTDSNGDCCHFLDWRGLYRGSWTEEKRDRQGGGGGSNDSQEFFISTSKKFLRSTFPLEFFWLY